MEKTSTTVTATSTPLQDKIIEYMVTHTGALLSALAIVIVGLLVARWIGNLAGRWLERRSMEPPVRMLLVRIIKLLMLALALVIALGTAGMDVTALIAGIGVAGVGVGLAMQGVLGNLVAGLTIIFTKPFRVGEYIEVVGESGQVQTIELFSTTLLHTDRSRVVIPNRKLVGEILHNYGTIRQLDMTVGVAYGTNVEEAIALIRDILKTQPRVLKDPVPVVGISALADSSINIAVKPWTAVTDYNPAGAEIYQQIVTRFRERGIEIPFPQREVRMLGNG
jgi:small conductance mechanosensitive channel